MSGKLFIVSTHIGNLDDLTLRAKRVLTEVDFIICEELKIAKQLLRQIEITKELIELNEHTEKVNSNIIIELLISGRNAALISDSGTPIFSDPGNHLIKLVIDKGINISIIPGPDSLIPSLIVSGFGISKFYYAGWLSIKSDLRKKELKNLKNIKQTIAIMETPYRLKQLLQDVMNVFGEKIKICLACDLTTTNEIIFRGEIKNVFEEIKNRALKPEFILVIDNNQKN